MKRRIPLSISLILSVLSLSLVSSDSTTRAQQRQRFTADTGVVTLGPNQKLRITVTGEAGATIAFRRMEYSQEACNSDGVCKLTVASQSTTGPITLMPGEAASMDHRETDFKVVRGMVLSDSRKVRVNAQIIDATTGQVDSIIAILIAD